MGMTRERAARPAWGLQIMQDRVDALEGVLEIDAAPGEGARVIGRVPARRLNGATVG
jgi:signal transduction histidine kinase